MRWVVKDDNGNGFEIYDYKATSLYSLGYPTPDELKKRRASIFQYRSQESCCCKEAGGLHKEAWVQLKL